LNELIENTLDALNEQMAGKAEPGDYIRDGLLYCGKCNDKKQCRITVSGREKIRWCLCRCQAKAYEDRRKQERETEHRLYIEGLRAQGIQDKDALRASFEKAEDGPEIRTCQKYTGMFDQMYKTGSGLLLWGDVGGGKTFAAACIANALINKEIPVLMTSFPRLLGAPFSERDEIIRQMKNFRLLILDDLGVERGSEYAVETIYRVVDARYKSGKPMIVTTNLTMEQMKHPQSIEYARIYDRIREVCVPVNFKGPNRRETKAKIKIREVRKILTTGDFVHGD